MAGPTTTSPTWMSNTAEVSSSEPQGQQRFAYRPSAIYASSHERLGWGAEARVKPFPGRRYLRRLCNGVPPDGDFQRRAVRPLVDLTACPGHPIVESHLPIFASIAGPARLLKPRPILGG
jgi:hypothetical protein